MVQPFALPEGSYRLLLTARPGTGSSTANVLLCIQRGRTEKTTLASARPSRSRQTLVFAQNFLKHPKMIGSIIPSSRFLVERLLQQVDWTRTRVVVEYGPGVGNITREILRRLPPDASLVAIEMNQEFVQLLREQNRDCRLKVVHGSAADVRRILKSLGHCGADYIISGIPYTTLPEDVRVLVMRESRAALNSEGALLIYQFTRAVLPYLRREFGNVRTDFEPLNVLPAQLFTCEKRRELTRA
jgi:phospholipid N-methyltransferase